MELRARKRKPQWLTGVVFTSLCRGACPAKSRHKDIHPSSLAIKMHHPIGESEERIVLSPTDVATGLKTSASLSHNDSAALDRLTADHLHSDSLPFAPP